ncbi:ATP-binding cassette domain-containing protein [Shouchella sp. JSM 1781072]|uniref:ATP-binding cassette domain-containing protein n=1 Tax=Bacillaceae TaxID=186817 RepID=UPI000C089518|nr:MULTISPECIES: ATP-binding cassette domain-containing protein [Bacillaceae]UTR06639.1 ATP-binding cassette domain-containing protein [Alkalihalobacillus sp. LMS6]
MEVCFKNVSYQYATRQTTQRHALQTINLHIPKLSFTAVVGKTGSGKSTLAQLISGVLEPTMGTVLVNGENIHDHQHVRALDEIGYVFQYPEQQLFADTVYEELAFGLQLKGERKECIQEKVANTLDMVELDPSILKRSPFHLSGGQMRRVAIAAILIMRPKLLILDEPTSGLDPKLKHGMMDVFRRYQQQERATIWMVTHSMDDVALYCDYCIALSEGKLVGVGKTADVLVSGNVPYPRAMAFANNLVHDKGSVPFLKTAEEVADWVATSWLKNVGNQADDK